MDQKMQDIIDQPILKVYPLMTEEQISTKLQKFQSVKEFKLELSCHANIPLVFNLVSQFLRDQKLLTKIEISIESKYNLLLDSTFSLLKDFNQITNLSLMLNKQEYFDSHSQMNISQCFSGYTNLVHFSFSINSKFLKNKEQLFRLYDLYSRNPHITKLDISILEIDERSSIHYSILQGISLLPKLEYLNLKINKCGYRMSEIIDCLKEELQEKNLLKELRLYFGQNCILEISDFTTINKILSNLSSLENLSIDTFNANSKFNKKEFEVYSLASLLNLKIIKFQINDKITKSFYPFIETISQMKELEKVELSFNLERRDSYDQDIEKFGKQLARIQSLNSLRLNLNYKCDISFVQLIRFINAFHSIQNLKELNIKSSFIKSSLDQNFDQNELEQVISKLRVFKFVIYGSNLTIKIKESILEAILKAEELEELVLFMKNHGYAEDVLSKSKSFQTILDNKKNLKLLTLYHPLQFNNDEQTYAIVNSLSQNPQLKNVDLKFTNEINTSFPLLSKLSSSISQLQNLTRLSIRFEDQFHLNNNGFNQFTEALKQMYNLNELHINIQKNNLQMDSLNSFTSALQSLKRMSLLFLEISGKKFEEDEEQIQFAKHFLFPQKVSFLNLKLDIPDLKFRKIEEIFKNISSLKKLQYLDINLKKIDINYFGCVDLQKYLSNLQRLKMIEMQYYAICMLHLVSLFKEIDSLTKIQFVYKYEQSLRSEVKATRNMCYQIPDESSHDSNKSEVLQDNISLVLKNSYLFAENEFDNDNYEILNYILDPIFPVTNLDLYIHHQNHIGSEFSSEFFRYLECFANLQCLNLTISSDNDIGSQSLNILGNAISTLHRLKKFSFTLEQKGNNILWEHCSDFISCFGNLKHIEQLELCITFENTDNESSNQVNSTTMRQLFQSIGEIKKLNNLKIQADNVELEEIGFVELKQMFSSLKDNLKGLVIFLRILSIEKYKLLLNSISKLVNLQSLEIFKYKSKIYFGQLRKLNRLVNLKSQLSNYEAFF